MADHDYAYKLLFSHPQMVRDLLEGFVREDWLAELDYDSLERLNSSYVSDDLRERTDDVHAIARSLVDWLKGPRQATLRRAFAVWINKVILGKRLGGAATGVEDLQQMATLIETRMKEWDKAALQRGRLEGRLEGEVLLLKRQLRKRFGELPAWVEPRLNAAQPEQLEQWGERVLEADSLDTLFNDD